CLIYIEAKVESPARREQLRQYRVELENARKKGITQTALVLLTKYAEDVEGLPDATVRWHHIGEWLSDEHWEQLLQDQVSGYLVTQFLGFLKMRGMIM